MSESGLSNKYIRALIKAKGSEKLANLKIGDILEVEISEDQIPKNIFLQRMDSMELMLILIMVSFQYIKFQKSQMS